MNQTAAGLDFEAALAACARGERDALRRLYDAEAAQLLAVALRILRRRDLAEDAVHDAFLQVWQKAASFDPARGSGRGWIYCVVRHRALNMLRDVSREVQADDALLEAIPDAGPNPLERLSETADARALKNCLEKLETPKRICILLAYVDGYSHQGIADRLKAPLGSVKAWIRRGLLALRECLS